MSKIAGRVRPFYCGSQSADWREWNCGNCRKQMDCRITDALDAAYFDDGTVSHEIGVRMGLPLFDCVEIETLISLDSYLADVERRRDYLRGLYANARMAAGIDDEREAI